MTDVLATIHRLILFILIIAFLTYSNIVIVRKLNVTIEQTKTVEESSSTIQLDSLQPSNQETTEGAN